MISTRHAEDNPDISPERLIGHKFSDLHAGLLLRTESKSGPMLWWMPVEPGTAANVAVLSGTITGVNPEPWLPGTPALMFERTDPEAPVSARPDVNHSLVIPEGGLADLFDAVLNGWTP